MSIHPFFQIKKKESTYKSQPPATPLPSPSLPKQSPSQLKPNFHKGETSKPHYISIQKPKFHSDTHHDSNPSNNFYGKIHHTVPIDSSIKRDLFHVTDRPYERCTKTWIPPSPTIDLTALIHQDPYHFFKQTRRVPKKQQQSRAAASPTITTQHELETFMNTYFPSWHTYPSCVLLSQSVWEPKWKKPSSQSWCDKYRPTCVNGLLGARYNHLYLKDWLHQMKIEPLSAPTTTSSKKKMRKIKRRMYDEDGEVLDDDDDDDFMLTPKKKKKPSMRSNIMVLVGDSGVGKTAAVYTVAEQMEYQVFEIHGGSKRSGKEIVSMVGEMTKSHLVAFQPPVVAQPPPSKKKRLSPTFSPSAQLTSQQKKGLLKYVGKQEKKAAQQSLILLEEVDLLFEEDKGFWASVIDLSHKSKRPIIMTCNDPDQVPFEDLCIQSVLNIQPPSDHELLPYLWLVCFCEGYVVSPSDLMYLMAFLGRDVRQLLQTLELYAGNDMFERYLGLDADMDLVELKSKSIPSRLAVDTFRLARFHKGQNSMEEDGEEKDFERLVRAIDNNAFIDAHLSIKGNGSRVHESLEDQLIGFTTLWAEDDDDTPSKWILSDMENELCILNSQSVETNNWRELLMDEGSHSQELYEASITNFEDYREAIEKFLPSLFIYQPNEQVIMMDYIPQIQIMISADVDKKSRSTRSKRKRLYLPLNEACVETLQSYKPAIDETEIWIQRLEKLKTL